ncbi:EamA family transporter RarD [Mariniblastus sp.]|nr:EamA family transporter RarD [Mariniblastus sp.]MDB4380619.1 EamA family transporter RarD [Mariniblastus sp.]
MQSVIPNARLGLVCAVVAQVLWGCFPIYVNALRVIAPFDFVAHRAAWSFLLLVNLVLISNWYPQIGLPKNQEIRLGLSSRKTILIYAIAAVLIATNWVAFVWSVMNDHAIDASLGYYICPLIVVLLGVVFLKEKLSKLRWIAVAFATVGVGYTTFAEGTLLWVSMAIAGSFGFYGLIKKRAPLSALGGLTFETGVLFLPAVAYLVWRAYASGVALGDYPIWVYILIVGSGAATILPLAFYATAVKHLPLSTVGFLQYIGPTIQFFVGVFWLNESMDYVRLTGFVFVWIGVVIFVIPMKNSAELAG